jgi:hypothetical protein
MAEDLTTQSSTGRRKLPVVTLLLAALILVVGLFVWNRVQERQRAEELAQAQGLVRVLSATFSKQSALKVGVVEGAFDVTTIDPGQFPILRSAQKVKLPYSIDYTVDLSNMTADQYRWDKDSRTLVVEAPDVMVGRPNIDEARRQTLSTQGIFVTRGAADNLSRRAAVQANRAATAEAVKPVHLDKARDNARRAIAAMLETPLELSGMGKVNVVVRLPQDGQQNSERWDVSPSIAEVLAGRR